MANRNNEEYKIALRDISQHAGAKFNSVDRIRLAEWLFKLASMGSCNCEDPEMARQKNLFAQLLRIQVRGGTLHGFFAERPPTNLPPFNRMIVEAIETKCGLENGQPIIAKHKSEHGEVYIALKPMPNKGFLAYMATSPTPFT